MFNPLPPASDPSPSAQAEPDHEPLPAWRPRGRWPTLLRLSWMCRLLALFSAISCGFLALFGLLMVTVAGPDQGVGLLVMFGALFSAVISYVVWMGLAELFLLAIAVERNTRQTRDRLPKHTAETDDVVDAVEVR
jgi:hypothetical protein